VLNTISIHRSYIEYTNATVKMPHPAKRAYRSDLRATQADATRRTILAAAGRVCGAGGWPSATIAAVAKEAGVSKETIYAVFGNKVALIGEMVKSSVAETAPGQHFLDEERPRAIRAEMDQSRQIDLWATYLTEILERVSPLLAVVRSGSEVEPEMAELYRALHQGRRANLSLIAASILEQGPLRDGLSVEGATDFFWQLASPEMFALSTGAGGYSTIRFAEWLSAMLKAALLPA
jgi:AcrR family transcriptional regulator